ncbi:TIGR01777 family oxidoreductase [Oceanobacter sp. 5_MG-2023]|uniref:TIGR01777 family oxidoreductase n=1 Tax=Oceanobacter sp. 5_MG-2023 TaxID=3062645 RepID=UPI0026E2B049|nr:TIGR01777 family oxidoreductase [Oceanobacter sp. 5_MG-2023]MDO6681603.1 TIGR01777 family oxidoreductase [Oceanobacter sp. 5_MG-2023]
MSKRILITGGSGFIGSRLVNGWLAEGYEIAVLTRRPDWVVKRWAGRVMAVNDLYQLVGPFDWLVNLAGEGIADQRWSHSRKQALRESRIGVTNRLAEWAIQTGRRFDVVASGSAIGVYGALSGTAAQQTVAETSPAGEDFAAQLCADWEQAAHPLFALSRRSLILRTGVVLGEQGGMLKRLWTPFSLGLGGRIGSGKQYLSWIHIEDYLAALNHLLASEAEGIVNMTAPEAVTNRDFTRVLATCLKRPALLPMPAAVARIVFGEMADLLLKGQRVLPLQLQEQAFSYRYTTLSEALASIGRNWTHYRQV